MGSSHTSDMQEVCDFCSQMLCIEDKGDEIVIQHHSNVADFIQHASKCILCQFIEQCWSLKGLHSRYPDLSEAYYASMPLKIRLSKPELLDTNVSWNLAEVCISSPKHAMTYRSKISIVACRDESMKSTFWTRPASSLSDKVALLKTWFDECVSSHIVCAPTGSVLPKRLITTGCFGEGIKIIRTADLNHKFTQYATLSHCWGSKLPLRTTRSNQAMLENSIAEANLPQTFRDAIELSRHLGIPYLWIDALCICQDDLDEWAQEAAIMKDVYVGSILTIAASNGTCSDDGCFSAMAPSNPLSRNVQFSVRLADENSLHVRAQHGDTRSLASETSLSSRGWVLQEEILSKRVVYCMLPELHWRCRCCFRMESGAVFEKGESNALPLLSGQVKADLHETWYQWMADYSERKFTFERDKLSAMAGIVELFASVSGDQHILGCWKESFAEGLLWLPLSRLPPRPGIPGIPSWCWLTRYDKVSYHIWTGQLKDFAKEFHVQLLDWDVKWMGTPLVSNITAAQVRIRGPVQDFVLSVAIGAQDYNPPYLSIGDELLKITNNGIPWRCSGRIDDDGDTKQSYICLLIWSASKAQKSLEIFLLLKPVISIDPNTTMYRRVGIAEFHGERPQFADKRYQDIVLV